MEGSGPWFGIDLARAGACHRSHSPIARALRGNGVADRRRQYLWKSATHGWPGSSFAFARGDGADFKEQAGRQSNCAGAGTYARDVEHLRFSRRASIKLRLDAL